MDKESMEVVVNKHGVVQYYQFTSIHQVFDQIRIRLEDGEIEQATVLLKKLSGCSHIIRCQKNGQLVNIMQPHNT